MASVFTVLTKLQADVSNFEKGMANAQASLNKLEKAVANTGGKMDKNLTKESDRAAKGLGRLKSAFGLAAVAGAAFAGINYVKGAVGAASAFEAEFVGVEQTFGSASQVVKDFAKNAAATAGLSEASALRYAKSFGGFANAAGLAGEAQAKFSTNLVQTAGDLGSFFDLPTEDALYAIQAGLRGEFEPLRRFNILLDETAIKTAAMNAGIYSGTGDLTAQQKVLGAQAAILGQVGVAQNDFTNYADTYGNSIKTVSALMQNLQADVGSALLPAMAQLAQAVIPVIEMLGPVLTKVFEALVPVIESITSSVGSLTNIFNPLLSALEPILTSFSVLVESILPPVIAIVSALAPIFQQLFDTIMPIVDVALVALGNQLAGYTVPMIEAFAKLFSTFVMPILQAFADVLGLYVMPALNGLAVAFTEGIQPVIEEFIGLIDNNLPQIQSTFADVFGQVAKAVQWAWDTVLVPVFGGIMDFFRDVLGIDMGTLTKIGESFAKGFKEGQDTYKKTDYSFAGEDARFAAMEAGTKAATNFATGFEQGLDTDSGAGKQVRNAWRELFLGFSEDVKKQEAKLALAGMGLSDALIETVLGDADWEKLYAKITKGGQSMADSLQASFNKTTAGIEEMTAKLNEFIAKADDFKKSVKAMFDGFEILPTVEDNFGRFEQQIVDFADKFEGKLAEALSLGVITEEQKKSLGELVTTHENAMRDIARQRDALDKQLSDAIGVKEFGKQFAAGLTDLLAGVQPLKYATESLGQFESAVVSTFESISASIAQAADAKFFNKELADSIKKTATETQTQLRTISRQRDRLAVEYQQFVDTLNSAKEFRTATRDAVKGYANITSLGTSARTILKNFGTIVKRTETFRSQLSTLNQMGLNKELYKQILDSGLDAGSATAKALLKGGPKAVEELNSMFAKLDMTASMVADDTTKVMFDGGESAIQGFMTGIMAQDEALRLEAEKIANTFTGQFQLTMNTADTNIDAMIASIKAQQTTLEATAKSLATAFNSAFTGALTTAIATNQAAVTPFVVDAEALSAINKKIAAAEQYKANMQRLGKWAEFAGATAKLDQYYAERKKIQGLATGGYISGGGTATSDSIPAMLSNGEFVMRAAAVQKFGAGFMSAINSGRVPAFATGGAVGVSRIASGGGGKTVINNKYEINVRTGIGDPAAIGKQVVSAIAAYEKTSGRQIIG